MRHAVALLLLVPLLAASGCTMSKEGRRGTMIAGAAGTLAGILIVGSGSVDSDNDGTNETLLNDDWGAYLAGTYLVTAGLAVFLVGLASSERNEPPPVARNEHFPSAEHSTGSTVSGQVAQTRTVGGPQVVALPELPATSDVLRIAKQIRSAVKLSLCTDARIMLGQLETIDGDYARALRDGPIMAPCSDHAQFHRGARSYASASPAQLDLSVR